MIQFEELGFAPDILNAVRELGFDHPMPVQEEVIPLMLGNNRDIIALAQTGTGKTAAFGLPLIQTTDTQLSVTQTLILCPTRELCVQITGDLNDFSRFKGKLKILAIYGGASYENQIRSLGKGVHIIVATPGRLIDLINRRVVNLTSVSTVILDEADEMLNMGFLESINEILETVPDTRRTLLFSATMSPDIATIARKYMNNPAEITIGTKNASAENVSHAYYLVHAKDKYKVLKRIADSEPEIYGIVFCRTRKETQEVASNLINDGYNADALHGDLSQSQRDTVMQKFRVRTLHLLVATDVAARGLDVDDLTHVINYSLPDDPGIYTHRCGRTGRAGKTGVSISLVHLREKQNLQIIEKNIRKKFQLLLIPTGNEICGRQLFHWVKRIKNVETEHLEIERFLPEIKEKLSDLDREELLRRIVSLEFDRFLDDYRFGEDLISPVQEKGNFNSERKDRRHNVNYARLFINLGKSDGFYPEQLIDLINRNTPGRKVPIGKIDIMKTFSFFEVDQNHSEELIVALNHAKFMDQKVAVEIAQPKPGFAHKENGNGNREKNRKPEKWLKRRNKGTSDRKNEGFRKNKKDRKRLIRNS
jgi:ATP-dependent RNA helicase DeaD